MYKLIAHRGNKKSSKENSLSAFFDAINSSEYVGFECDVRMTKDEKMIVYHDPIYNGKLVRNLKYQDFNSDILLIEDVLSINTDKIIMVDIKDPFINVSKLLDVLKRYSTKKIYVMSFYDNVIRKLFLADRKYKIGILNYVLNTEEQHFKYDFLCILEAISNSKIINDYQNKQKDLFIYGVKKENLKDLYPYYIVD